MTRASVATSLVIFGPGSSTRNCWTSPRPRSTSVKTSFSGASAGTSSTTLAIARSICALVSRARAHGAVYAPRAGTRAALRRATIASISTPAPRGSAATPTVARAGGSSAKNSAQTSLTSAKPLELDHVDRDPDRARERRAGGRADRLEVLQAAARLGARTDRDELAARGVERDLARAEQQVAASARRGCRGRSRPGAPGACDGLAFGAHRPRHDSQRRTPSRGADDRSGKVRRRCVVRHSRSRSRRLAVAPALLAVGGASASAATSTIPFTTCPDAPAFGCAHLTVPLDPTGVIPGTVTLSIRRKLAATGAATEAVIALAGGPGQAALPFATDAAQIMQSALATRDLVVFDQRGTGDSGALKCSALRDADRAAQRRDPRLRARRSARPAGSTRPTTPSPTSSRSARRSATRSSSSTAPPTARRSRCATPPSTRRTSPALVLDSTVPPNGPDVFDQSTYQAVPRILDAALRRRRLPRASPTRSATSRRSSRASSREPGHGDATTTATGRLQPVTISAERRRLRSCSPATTTRSLRADFPAAIARRRARPLRAARDPRRPRRDRRAARVQARSTTRSSSTPSARSCRSRGTAPTRRRSALQRGARRGAGAAGRHASARSARATACRREHRAGVRLLAVRDRRAGDRRSPRCPTCRR